MKSIAKNSRGMCNRVVDCKHLGSSGDIISAKRPILVVLRQSLYFLFAPTVYIGNDAPLSPFTCYRGISIRTGGQGSSIALGNYLCSLQLPIAGTSARSSMADLSLNHTTQTTGLPIRKIDSSSSSNQTVRWLMYREH